MDYSFISDAILITAMLAFTIYCHWKLIPVLKDQTEALKIERQALNKELKDKRESIQSSILFTSICKLGEGAEDFYLAYISTIKSIDTDQWIKDREINAAKFMLRLNAKLIEKF